MVDNGWWKWRWWRRKWRRRRGRSARLRAERRVAAEAEGAERAGAELRDDRGRRGERAEELGGAPRVVLQVLRVLRVDRVLLAPHLVDGEGGRDEEVREPVHPAAQLVGVDLEVEVGVVRRGEGVGAAVALGEEREVRVLHRVLGVRDEDHVLEEVREPLLRARVGEVADADVDRRRRVDRGVVRHERDDEVVLEREHAERAAVGLGALERAVVAAADGGRRGGRRRGGGASAGGLQRGGRRR